MKIVRFLTCAFLSFCVLFTFFVGRNEIGKEKNLSTTNGYKGIITLWHIDTFEGGTGSRKQFLLKTAREYEKINDGVLIFATSHTVESVKENFAKGTYPDLISYGQGVEVENLLALTNISAVEGGKIGGEVVAIPWCRGGYFLIRNNNFKPKKGEGKKCLVSNAEYSLPLLALLDWKNKFDLLIKNQYSAYQEFVNNNAEYLLGTQRDVVRLINREFSFSAQPLSTYNDLYQYISIIKGDEEKVEECRGFVDFLLSEKQQKKLAGLNMFSCFYEVEFENEYMIEMQKLKSFPSVSAFNTKEIILELKNLSYSAYGGNEDSVNKLKKFIV